MSVTKCLKCEEAVLIPAGASLKATVRCPLCQEQFELGELLDELPPPLEIVEDPEAVPVSAAKPFNFEIAGQGEHSEGADTYRVGEDQDDADAVATVPAFQFDDSSQAEAGDGSAGPAYRATPRPKRKEKNPAIEIAKVFGGGVLGIAIAIVGIWWIAKKDPFKIGPMVGGVAPWIVPEQFRGEHGDVDDSDDDENDKKNAQGENELDRERQRQRATASRTQNEHIGERNFSKSPFSEPNGDDTKTVDGSTVDSTQPSTTTNVDRTSPEFSGIRNTPTPTPEDLEQAANAADVALTKWAPEQDFDSENFRNDAFEAIKVLGKSIATANQQDAANQRSIKRTQSILSDFKGKDEKLAIINAWAAEQLEAEEADVQGILLSGKVTSIAQLGTLYETRLVLPTDGKEEIAVMTVVDPSSFSPPGSIVIVIGALVNDPATNFASYGGNDLQVICCGRLDLLQRPAPKKVQP